MKKFIKFCIVGVVNTGVTFVLFYVLNSLLGVNYLISSFIGYTAGVINSFILNRRWTFKDNGEKASAKFIKFAILNVVSLGVNLLVIYICVDKLHIVKNFSQIIATGFSTVVNYIGSRILVFNDGEKVSDEEDKSIKNNREPA